MNGLKCMFGFHYKIEIRTFEQIYATHNGKFIGEKILETTECKYCGKKFKSQYLGMNRTPHNGVYNF